MAKPQIVDMHGRPVTVRPIPNERPVSEPPRPAARAPRKPSSGMFPKSEAQRPLPPPSTPALPLTAAQDVASVYVRGRRVAWSRSPAWSPLRPAFGKEYDVARLLGHAGVRKSGVIDVVRDLLNEGASAVIVHSDASDRVVHVSKPEDGGSIRAAWSETSLWSPFEDARTSAGRAARESGAAGVEVGLEGLRKALRGI